MGTPTTVVDGKPVSRPQFRLKYDGVELKTTAHNDIAKRILTCATLSLAKVFKDKKLNPLVITVFKRKDILQDIETECLDELNLTSTDWAMQFLKLLGERYDRSEALQLLCNLYYEEQQLKNYQRQIHLAFQDGQNETLKLVRVEEKLDIWMPDQWSENQ
ncbi:unnamed protein product [Orchesella dallaii]|uniref:Uncharacterized protein n=1 Tax=Orchesella dallaii TaxID=48710 RepID=A0ABP1R0V6_9HEXA